MAKKRNQPPSPQTEAEADQIARATQRPGQSSEQTKLIAQGIKKGIDEYKKQQKAKAREADKQRKKQQRRKPDQQAVESEVVVVRHQHPLPWVLQALSWAGFIAWLRVA